MTLTDYGNIWVCTDCYYAHHYGAHEIKPEDADKWNKAGWYAGESDTPCDREPLSGLDDFHIFDNTCSNHANGWHVEPDPDDEDDWIDVPDPCPHCGGEDDENGIQEFSMSRCQGCGSNLGGSRYRLALYKEES